MLMISANDISKIDERLLAISISVSYDMGWQKRSTGRIYDSLSGHGFFIGCLTGNVIMMGIMKKNCSQCGSDTKAMPHMCTVHWDGSSGAM